MKSTDSGRKVFGGGGITPDEKYASEKLSIFQRRMGYLRQPNMFFRFANSYFGTKKAESPEGWQPDDTVLAKFRTFLSDNHVTFTD